MLHTGERTFDDAAPPKRSSVECRRPPTYLLPCFLRVAFGPFLRDHRSYAAGTQVVAVTSGSISTVSQGDSGVAGLIATTPVRDFSAAILIKA